MLSVTPMASGSKGNCLLLQSGETNILVDIGIPLFYVEDSLKKLGVAPAAINAVFVTHEHIDHIGGVQAFAVKYGAPVYISCGIAARVKRKLSRIAARKIAEFEGGEFFFKDMTVSPFPLSHDVPCTGFGFTAEGGKISMLTDAGVVGDALLKRLADSDAVLIEANHDVDILKASKTYPLSLKRRILSDFGHLSNAACSEAVAKLALGGVTRKFILAHLSQENNYPELALSSASAALSAYNITAGRDVELSVAEQYKMCKTIQVG